MNNPEPACTDPLVSVIIPAYNAEQFIERTVQSVLNQTYRTIEVIVIDDGSQDRTAALVRAIAHHDPRVILLQQSNSGVAAARNVGIQTTQGEFIAPIDADDIWYPTHLEKQVRCLIESGPATGFVYSWSLEIDEADELSGGFHIADYHGDVYLPLIHRDFLGNASASLIRRECFETVGGYDCSFREKGAQGCEDWDLYLRIAERYSANVVPEFLVGYRQNPASMSRNYKSMAKSHSLVLETVLKRHPEIPTVLYQWSMSNFYIYLAHQSCQIGQYRASQSCLYNALRLDWRMVLLRPDLYVLLIYYWLGMVLGMIRQSRAEHSSQPKNRPCIKQPPPNLRRKIQLSDIENRIRIRSLLPSKRYEWLRLEALRKNGMKTSGTGSKSDEHSAMANIALSKRLMFNDSSNSSP